MEIIHAIILGIVEGLTEFLPVSSTGHLILASRFLKVPPSEFLSSFEIAIQIGAILAVLALYGKKYALNPAVLSRLAAAFVPTAVIGFVLYKLVKQVLMNSVTVVLVSLFLGGLFLIVFERFHKKGKGDGAGPAEIPYGYCFLIGLFQALAVIPGVSRSAATIIGGLALGLSRKTVVEFSFLLAVPTLLAATALDLAKTGIQFSGREWALLAVGAAVSFATAILAIRFFLQYVQRHSFVVFGVYRIALAAIFWLAVRPQ